MRCLRRRKKRSDQRLSASKIFARNNLNQVAKWVNSDQRLSASKIFALDTATERVALGRSDQRLSASKIFALDVPVLTAARWNA